MMHFAAKQATPIDKITVLQKLLSTITGLDYELDYRAHSKNKFDAILHT